MSEEDFLSRVSDLDRRTRLARKDGGGHLQRNDFTLAAETAAHQRLDDADLTHRHFEHIRQCRVEVVGNLCG